MSPLSIAPFMGALAGIGIAIDSAETLVAHRSLAPTGLYSWDVLGVGRRYLVAGPLGRSLGSLFRYPSVLILPAIQLLAGAALISGPVLPPLCQRWIIATAALTAAAARMLFYMRQQLGLDGADQMLVIVLVSAGFGAVLGNTIAGFAAVDYAAFQLLLSYAISGIAKAFSTHWRSGSAIVGITGTIGYGQPWLHSILERSPIAAKLVRWSVIIFECGAIPIALAGVKGAWIIIFVGMCFHLGIAFVMGLNIFVWAFAGCYPALLLLTDQVHALARR